MSGFDEPLFCRLLDAVLPNGGWVVAFSHAYFDESGTHEGSPVMTMAGYVFDHDQARKFSRDWSKDLNRFGLSCAHMTDCALGYGEYPIEFKRENYESIYAAVERFGGGVRRSSPVEAGALN